MRKKSGPDILVGSIGDELALRAALDPAWDAVLRAYLDPPGVPVARDP